MTSNTTPTPLTMLTTLAQAKHIITAALARSSEFGHKPKAVVVLDASGHRMAAQREDGASMFRVDVATRKAWAAVGMCRRPASLHSAGGARLRSRSQK